MIHIMYSDLSIVAKPDEEINYFKKDDILFILVKDFDKNLFSLSKFDKYGIDVKNRNYVQLNDGDGAIHSFENGKTVYRDLMPKGFTSFKGGYIDEWDKATKKFYSEMV